jgi:hypothetical protein
MNKDQIISLIQNPEQITSVERQGLYDLVQTWSFFQTAHILLLHSLKNAKSPEFDQQLRKSAVFVADRKVLFNYLYGRVSELQNIGQPDIEIVQGQTKTMLNNDLLEIDDKAAFIDESDEEPLISGPVNVEDKSIDAGFELETDIVLNNYPEALPQPSPLDLIDKFIEENPAFIANKLDLNEERKDISLDSIQEPEEIATESLALIYAGQGLNERAISIYEKLILKFPEKSTYFASLIDELRMNLK